MNIRMPVVYAGMSSTYNVAIASVNMHSTMKICTNRDHHIRLFALCSIALSDVYRAMMGVTMHIVISAYLVYATSSHVATAASASRIGIHTKK